MKFPFFAEAPLSLSPLPFSAFSCPFLRKNKEKKKKRPSKKDR